MNRMSPHNGKKRFADSIRFLSSEDFDGHTGFSGMSPEERLMWLSQAAQFFHEHNRTDNRVFTTVSDPDTAGDINSTDR
ncbi:MAG: hypothetical protein ACLFVQ_08870 [Chitinispirillaceae bacterium]